MKKPDLVNELEIQAGADEIWRALTEAEELVKWFPLTAEVAPGKSMVWGWEVPEWTWAQTVTVWEEGKHLQTTFGGQVLDWTIEGQGGASRVRLVHSGFDTANEWEDEHYEGTKNGWQFETIALKHYLERHRGKRRTSVWPRVRTTRPAQEVWNALHTMFGSPAEAGAFDVHMATGDRMHGTVLQSSPPRTWSGIAEDWDDGMVRIELHAHPSGGLEAGTWLSAWGVAEEKVRAFGDRWQRELVRII